MSKWEHLGLFGEALVGSVSLQDVAQVNKPVLDTPGHCERGFNVLHQDNPRFMNNSARPTKNQIVNLLMNMHEVHIQIKAALLSFARDTIVGYAYQ